MRKCLVYCLAVILSYQMLSAREATNVEPLARKMTSAKWYYNVPVEWSENGKILSLVYEPGTSNLFALILSDTGGTDTWAYKSSDGVTWNSVFSMSHIPFYTADLEVSQERLLIPYGIYGDIWVVKYDLVGDSLLPISHISNSDTLEKVDVETDGDIYYPIEDYFYMVTQTKWGGNRYVKFWKTTDGGDSWDPVSIIDSGDIKGVRIAFDDASEYLFIAYIKGDSIFLVKSLDYGDSWDSPQKISAHYHYTGDFALAAYDSVVFVIADYISNGFPYQVRLYGTDLGTSWNYARIYAGYKKPDATMRGDGILRLVFLDTYRSVRFQNFIGFNIITATDTIPYAWTYPVLIANQIADTTVYPRVTFSPLAANEACVLYTARDTTFFDRGEVDTVFTNLNFLQVDAPTRVTPGDTTYVKAIITNSGLEDIDNYALYASIYDMNANTYLTARNYYYGYIAVNDTDTVIIAIPPMPNLKPPHKLRLYATISTGSWDEWYGDNNPGYEYMVAVQDSLFSPFAQVIPVLDGEISPGEWDDAEVVDISNTYGMYYVPTDTCLSDTAYEVDTATVWAFFKNDTNWLYIAIVGPDSLISLESFVEIDEDNSGDWAADTTEGAWLFCGDSLWYFVPRIDTEIVSFDTVGNTMFSTDTSGGYRTYEIAIPLDYPDHDAGFIDAQPGDTIGIGIVVDNGPPRIGGWYPQDFQVYTGTLSLYAKLVLGIMPGVEENMPFARSLIFAPAFSRGAATIKMNLPDTRHVKLVIYDPAGRKVKTLVDRRLEKGVHYFSFAPQRTGMYILKGEIGSLSYTKKMVVIK